MNSDRFAAKQRTIEVSVMSAEKQGRILIGMLAAIVVCTLAVFAWDWGAPAQQPQTAGDRLAFAVHWLLLPALTLFAGVGLTASRRFFTADAIDGQRQVPQASFEINLRYNQNTLEQVVLAACAWTSLALTLPVEDLGLIPRLAVLFCVGRVTFWLGYLYAPWARAFGMGVTAYPTFVALVVLAWEFVK
jgi:hypothetical protein